MNNHYHGKDLLHLLNKHNVPFSEGNIMKYVFRWREKGGLDDLYKAQDYLNELITRAESLNKLGPITERALLDIKSNSGGVR